MSGADVILEVGGIYNRRVLMRAGIPPGTEVGTIPTIINPHTKARKSEVANEGTQRKQRLGGRLGCPTTNKGHNRR